MIEAYPVAMQIVQSPSTHNKTPIKGVYGVSDRTCACCMATRRLRGAAARPLAEKCSPNIFLNARALHRAVSACAAILLSIVTLSSSMRAARSSATNSAHILLIAPIEYAILLAPHSRRGAVQVLFCMIKPPDGGYGASDRT